MSDPAGAAPWALAREFDPASIPARIPVFIVPGIVLFPHTLLPLHVFEPRYRQMVEDAQSSGGTGLIAMAQPVPGDEGGGIAGEGPPVAPIAGVGRIIGHHQLADGRSNIVLLGVARVRLIEYVETESLYHVARIEPLQPRGGQADSTAEARVLADRIIRVAGELPEARNLPGFEQLQDPAIPLEVVLDQVACIPSIPPPERQRLLQTESEVERAAGILQALQCALAFRQVQDGEFPDAGLG